MNKTSLNLPYLILAGVIVIGIVFIFVVIYPMFSSLRNTQQKVADINSKLVERKDFLRTVDQKIAILNAQQAQENAVAVMLPSDDAMKDILRVIDQSSTASGVVISGIINVSSSLQSAARADAVRGGKNQLPDHITSLGIQIKLAGTYAQVRDFLSQIEHSIRLSDAISVAVHRNERQPDQIEGDVMIRFYKYDK